MAEKRIRFRSWGLWRRSLCVQMRTDHNIIKLKKKSICDRWWLQAALLMKQPCAYRNIQVTSSNMFDWSMHSRFLRYALPTIPEAPFACQIDNGKIESFMVVTLRMQATVTARALPTRLQACRERVVWIDRFIDFFQKSKPNPLTVMFRFVEMLMVSVD
jgi:hypothetical protein